MKIMKKIDKDMSLIKITITDNHLKLLKYLRWSVNKAGFIIGTEDEDEDQAPFVENNLYEAINLILNGIPENFDPLNTEDEEEYSTEQKAEWDKLYSELPRCLQLYYKLRNLKLVITNQNLTILCGKK
jgi:hypothetical protein